MKNIVALVDFSDLTFKVLKQAHDLTKAFDANLVLLHVVPKEPTVVDLGVVSPTVLTEPTDERLSEDAGKLLELQESLAKFGTNVTSRQIRASSVDELLAEARQLAPDLIIVGSHGHGALYSLMVGSVSHQVLKKAPCPVLVVPEDAAKQ